MPTQAGLSFSSLSTGELDDLVTRSGHDVGIIHHLIVNGVSPGPSANAVDRDLYRLMISRVAVRNDQWNTDPTTPLPMQQEQYHIILRHAFSGPERLDERILPHDFREPNSAYDGIIDERPFNGIAGFPSSSPFSSFSYPPWSTPADRAARFHAHARSRTSRLAADWRRGLGTDSRPPIAPPVLPAPPLPAPAPPHPQDQPLNHPLPPTEPRATPLQATHAHPPPPHPITRPAAPVPPAAAPPHPDPDTSQALPLPPRRIHTAGEHAPVAGPLFHAHLLPVSALRRGDILDDDPAHPRRAGDRITAHWPCTVAPRGSTGHGTRTVATSYRVAGVRGLVMDPSSAAAAAATVVAPDWVEYWPAARLVRVWREGAEWRDWTAAVDAALASSSDTAAGSDCDDRSRRVPPPLIPPDGFDYGLGSGRGSGSGSGSGVGPVGHGRPSTLSWREEYALQLTSRRRRWLAEVRARVRPEFRIENGYLG